MSSKRRLRRKACDGKQRHESAAEGLQHIRELRRKDAVQGQHHGRINVYRCKFCKGYHVGHA